MARRNPVVPASVSGFSDYFDLSAGIDLITRALGYQYRAVTLALPRHSGPIPFIPLIQERVERGASLVTLDTEVARREFLIGPLLLEIAVAFGVTVRSEFALDVSDALRGSVDYLLESDGEMVVIDAKLGDLTRGFKQLAAELAALDQWTESSHAILYGAVTTGDAWRFGMLDRNAKTITQDIAIYGYPHEIETIVRALVAMLQPNAERT